MLTTTALGKFKIPQNLADKHVEPVTEMMNKMEEHIEGSGGR